MKDDHLYLGHIRDAINRIECSAAVGHDAFLKNKEKQDAIVRNLEIIGEATKKMSQTTKDKAPTIPWREIAGMRDKVVHDYAGVNLNLVWETVHKDLPQLKKVIDELLSKLKKEKIKKK